VVPATPPGFALNGLHYGLTDRNGRLGSTAWTYDNRGRVQSETKNIDGQNYLTGFSYNAADLPLTMQYPDGEIVTNTYTPQMLLKSVTGTDAYVTNTTYDSAGRTNIRTFGNGTQSDYDYNPWNTQGGRLKTIKSGTAAAPAALQNLTYSYDAVGNITQIANPLASETQAYGYDALDRLTSWTLNGVQQEAYGYNGTTGNLETKGSLTLLYNNAAHVHAVTNGNSYLYDANGSQITRTVNNQTFNLAYDAEGRLVTVTGPSMNAQFIYDGDGARVKSIINGTNTLFIGGHYEVQGANITKYYFAGAQRIAVQTNGTLSFLLSDYLGSTSLTTDTSGNVVSELRYKAWGEVRYSNGASQTKYTYTGQYSNADDFGLMYYNARWYDSSLGRFAQADTVVPGGVQGYDRYAYVNNNPLNQTDPSGHYGKLPCFFSCNGGGMPVSGWLQVNSAAIGCGLLGGCHVALVDNSGGPWGGKYEIRDNPPNIMPAPLAIEAAPLEEGMAEIENYAEASVCRSGTCTAELFSGGTGVVQEADGTLSGVSVNIGPTNSEEELKALTSGVPNKQIGVTTGGEIGEAGGTIVLDPSPDNPFHAMINGLTPEELQALFQPTRRNPNFPPTNIATAY